MLFTETGIEPGLFPDLGVYVAEDRGSAVAKPDIRYPFIWEFLQEGLNS